MKEEKVQRRGYGKLLDAWTAPEGAGEPIGCVASSFTFSPTFFEEECLGRFLCLETDATQDGPAYLIEREEKLAGVMCATALVDQHHCRGSRSLRWDLLPVRLPRGGIQHAKISFLCWRNCTRIIVASANLTEAGYRRNREVFGVLDYHEGGHAPLQCLRDLVDFARDILAQTGGAGKGGEPPVVGRVTRFLDRLAGIPESWGSTRATPTRREITVTPVLVGRGRKPALEQLREAWPGPRPVRSAYVTSPFFDPPGATNRPAEALWVVLRQRGAAEVSFNVTVEKAPDGALFINAPESIVAVKPRGRKDVAVRIFRVTGEGDGADAAVRPLHMKSIWLENEDWASYMIGSSNFTSAGLGLSAAPNFEANLVYHACYATKPRAYRMLHRSYPECEEIGVTAELRWKPCPDEDAAAGDGDTVLPAGFRYAEYGCTKDGKAYVKLSFGSGLPAGWRVTLPGINTTVYSEGDWDSDRRPQEARLPWQDELPPSGFEVVWGGSKGAAWWPVNIAAGSALPPPEVLRDLPLEVLISILTSARPLHEVLRDHWRRRPGPEDGPEKGLVDPHKRVDTSAFLMQRARRLSFALTALRARLEAPIATEDVLGWRLYGPVGVRALKEAILREARSPEERQYLLAELALELSRVTPGEAPGCLAPECVREALRRLIEEMRAEIDPAESSAAPLFARYVEGAFSRALA